MGFIFKFYQSINLQMYSGIEYDRAVSDSELYSWDHFETFAKVDGNDSDLALVKSLKNDADYVGRELTTRVSVPGNIHRLQFRQFWMEILNCSDLIKNLL